MPLHDAQIRQLRPGPKPTKHSDGYGLFLLLQPTGTKLWRFAYRFQGRQKLLAIGPYPLVTLAAARAARDEARLLIREGKDPAALRRMAKLEAKYGAASSFRAVADEWFENNQPRWVTSYAIRLRTRLDDDLLPRLGSRPISEILPLEVLEAIRAVERRGAVEMARRILQMASAIFRYGVATSRCPRDPTTDLRGALRAKAPTKHRTALPASELPEFLARLEGYYGDPVTRMALKLVILTFVRTSELRLAQWNEFEGLGGANPLWRIPPERMKMRRPHLVPLAPQAIAVLRELRRLSARSPFVLPAPTNLGVISENTMIFALYRLGYHGRATVHGFRSTASTVLNEHQFNPDWIEAQLAHSDDSVRGIYNAAQWLPGRRQMMLWWAQYLDEALEQGLAWSQAVPVQDPFAASSVPLLPSPKRRPAAALPEPLRRRSI